MPFWGGLKPPCLNVEKALCSVEEIVEMKPWPGAAGAEGRNKRNVGEREVKGK